MEVQQLTQTKNQTELESRFSINYQNRAKTQHGQIQFWREAVEFLEGRNVSMRGISDQPTYSQRTQFFSSNSCKPQKKILYQKKTYFTFMI